jgi:TRAP-type C4-dicarboxylate transport system permease small subunit
MRVGSYLSTVSKWIAGLCLLSIVAATSTQVFCRYALGAPLPWPEEFSRLMFVMLAYAGALSLPEMREHIAIEFIYDAAPRPLQIGIDIFIDLVAIIFFGFLAASSWELTEVMAGILMPALRIPTNIMFGSVAAAAAAQTIIYAESLIYQVWGAWSGTPVAIERPQTPTGQWE